MPCAASTDTPAYAQWTLHVHVYLLYFHATCASYRYTIVGYEPSREIDHFCRKRVLQDRFQAQGFASTPRPTYIADGSAVHLLSII